MTQSMSMPTQDWMRESKADKEMKEEIDKLKLLVMTQKKEIEDHVKAKSELTE